MRREREREREREKVNVTSVSPSVVYLRQDHSFDIYLNPSVTGSRGWFGFTRALNCDPL